MSLNGVTIDEVHCTMKEAATTILTKKRFQHLDDTCVVYDTTVVVKVQTPMLVGGLIIVS